MNRTRTVISAYLLACASAGFTISPSAIAGDPEAGKQKAAVCAGCHGVDGNSQIAANPILAGQHADYLEHVLIEYRNGKRQNPIMGGLAAGLSDEDIADLAAWFSSQDGLKTLDREPL